MKQHSFRFFFVVVLLGSLAALTSCETKTEKKEAEKPFAINDSIAKIITIDTVQSHELEGNLELNGEVTFDQTSMLNVFSLTTGVAEEVKVQMGDYVQKGQVLATIRTNDLLDLQKDLATNIAEANIAKKEYDVAKDLETKGINSQKEVLEAEQNLNKENADVEALKKELAVIGGDATGAVVYVRSPISGYVVERHVNSNQNVDKADQNQGIEPLFVISDLKNVWVMANVYEADIEKVKLGEQVNISTIAYPDKVFKGTINFISNVLDPVNKTMKVRVVLNNPNVELKPEMFAKVILDYKQKNLVPCIPHESVVFDDSKTFVVVYQSRDKLAVRQIDLYPTHEKVLYVRSGLQAGEVIVSKNQLLIYNALISL
jgi:cobalt-zinc-cadmium efflux system membrane fusion protein